MAKRGEDLIDTKEIQRPTLGPNVDLIDRDLALAALPQRQVGAHKWGVGGLVIVAGAPGYAGAAILCAMAATRAGAGIVNVALPRSLAGALTILVPEAVTIPLPEGDASGSGRRAAELIEPKLEKSKAMVIGPGLGEDEPADLLLRALFGGRATPTAIGFGLRQTDAPAPGSPEPLKERGLPLAIDADGLNWLANQEDWWHWLNPRQAVLTPHLGELERLTGSPADTLTAHPVAAAREAAARWQQVVVLKYGYAVVTDGDRVLIAEDAPPSLATAGTGDVLAGTIGAFLAQGLAPMSAAALAVYAGVRAARRVEAKTGTLGLVASDLPLAIAGELAELERSKEQSGG
jgi:NAD(P)H-hydrate epimerase